MNIFIIGGINSLGIELGNYFLSLGYHVIMGYHNNKDNINREFELVHCDITNETEVEEVISKLILKYGRIDIMINLSCICQDNYYLDKRKEEFLSVLETNLVGYFLTMKYYYKYNNGGLIINFSSTDGIDTMNLYNLDYACSKAGIITLTKGFSQDNKNSVISISPNWIDTDSTKEIDNYYLEEEMKRINQTRLIKIDEIITFIDEYVVKNKKYNSGDNFRIDIKGDKIWIEKK